MTENEHRHSKHPSDEAFERLYRAHRRAVYRFVLRDLGDPQEAEDVTQMAFLDAYRALARGNRPEEPRPWLFTIARNASRRRFRRPQHDEVPLEDSVQVVDPGAAEAAAREIVAAVVALPSRYREVLLLREVHGYSAAETAGELGTSIASVEMALFRARREVRSALERAGFGPERHNPLGLLAGLLPVPAASLGAVGIGATLVVTLAGGGSATPGRHLSTPTAPRSAPPIEAVVSALQPADPHRAPARRSEPVEVAGVHPRAFEPDALDVPDAAPEPSPRPDVQPPPPAPAAAPAPAPGSTASVQAPTPVGPLAASVDPPDVPAVKVPALSVAQAPLVPAAGAVAVPAAQP
jgi:RNA polymerase sigma factor (sigma-70 family)